MDIKGFLFKERENRFLDGIVDNPMMFFYELIGNNKEADRRCGRGVKNIFDPYYTAGEFVSLPLTVPLAAAALSKKAYQYLHTEHKNPDYAYLK